MRRFYYVVNRKDGRKYNRQIAIFKHTRNGVEFLCKTRKYSTASTPGEASEVLQCLAENGVIPKRWLDLSRTSWRGAGYYAGPVCNLVLIRELRCQFD